MKILPGDFTDPQVIELLRIHLAGMHRSSPKDSVFALDLSGLQSPDIRFLTAWEGNKLLGCGALKELSGDSGELKSMRTHPDHLRRGAARHLLGHLLDLARARGYRRVSLETGSGEAFDAALALYRSAGFANGEAFGGYAATGFNQFLHLDM